MKRNRTPEQRANAQSSVKTNTTSYQARPQSGVRLVNKREAAAILGISHETLKKYRLQENSSLIEGIHYHVWNSRVIRYNPDLLSDWGLNRNNPSAHQRAIEIYLASLPANQPRTRGRKAKNG
jgi:hypothetical protein